jgi:hypothetical protein
MGREVLVLGFGCSGEVGLDVLTEVMALVLWIEHGIVLGEHGLPSLLILHDFLQLPLD